MRQVTKYESNDGELHDSAEACLWYELTALVKKHTLYQHIAEECAEELLATYTLTEKPVGVVLSLIEEPTDEPDQN